MDDLITMDESEEHQFDGAVRTDVRRGDRDLGPVAYAELAHDFADVDFHGGFGHAELATDYLVGVALAETNENGVLPLGKLGRMPRTVEATFDAAGRRACRRTGSLAGRKGRPPAREVAPASVVPVPEAVAPGKGRVVCIRSSAGALKVWLARMAVGGK